LFAPDGSRRETNSRRFPHAAISPATGSRLRKSSWPPAIFTVDATGTAGLSRLHAQEAADKGDPRIAVIQRRFYDLEGSKATPFSDAGKAASHRRRAHEKAWLTFSGYGSLIAFATIRPEATDI
jgi:hypothetical protein